MAHDRINPLDVVEPRVLRIPANVPSPDSQFIVFTGIVLVPARWQTPDSDRLSSHRLVLSLSAVHNLKFVPQATTIAPAGGLGSLVGSSEANEFTWGADHVVAEVDSNGELLLIIADAISQGELDKDQVVFWIRAPLNRLSYHLNVVTTAPTNAMAQASVRSLTLDKQAIAPGESAIATVVLSRPLPDDVELFVTTDRPNDFSVPDAVAISGGETAISFPVKAIRKYTDTGLTEGTITVFLPGGAKEARVTLGHK